MRLSRQQRKLAKLFLSSRTVTAAVGLTAGLTVLVVTAQVLTTYHRQLNRQAAEKVNAQRIMAIYDKLALPATYAEQSSYLFGAKRADSWEIDRPTASERVYTRNADVQTTVQELRAAIEQAGFTYLSEPSVSSAWTQLHFRSARQEYIQLIVTGMLYEAAVSSNVPASVSGQLPDPGAGPARVIMKVNLNNRE